MFMANCEQNMYMNEHSHYIKLNNKLSSTIKTPTFLNPLLAFYQGLISLLYLATTKTTIIQQIYSLAFCRTALG